MSDVKPGKLIAIEGPNRAGKTTVLREVARQLRQHGHNMRVVNEFQSTVGQDVRVILGQDWLTPETRALLYAAVRLDSLRTTQPQLDRGCTLLYDRYLWSSLAYHSETPELRDFCEAINQPCRPPDYVVVLDGEPERLAERDPHSKLGQQFVHDLERQRQVRQVLLDLAHEAQMPVVDALQDLDVVVDDVVQLLRRYLELHR